MKIARFRPDDHRLSTVTRYRSDLYIYAMTATASVVLLIVVVTAWLAERSNQICRNHVIRTTTTMLKAAHPVISRPG